MLRIITGVIVGWIVLMVIVMAVFVITVLALGGFEKALQPASYWTTNTFNIIVLIGGFIAAIIGGWVCVLITRNSKAAFALAAVFVVMGISSALMNMNKPDPPIRTGPAKLEDLMTHGKEPNWFAFSNPVIAAIGVLIGSQLVKSRPTDTPER